jgi:hypothetical protein
MTLHFDNLQQSFREIRQEAVKSGIIKDIVELTGFNGKWAIVDIDGEEYKIPAKPDMKIGDRVIIAGGENFF